jgi:hypothetical protein
MGPRCCDNKEQQNAKTAPVEPTNARLAVATLPVNYRHRAARASLPLHHSLVVELSRPRRGTRELAPRPSLVCNNDAAMRLHECLWTKLMHH